MILPATQVRSELKELELLLQRLDPQDAFTALDKLVALDNIDFARIVALLDATQGFLDAATPQLEDIPSQRSKLRAFDRTVGTKAAVLRELLSASQPPKKRFAEFASVVGSAMAALSETARSSAEITASCAVVANDMREALSSFVLAVEEV